MKEFVRAVRIVHGGDTLLAPAVTRRLINAALRTETHPPGAEYERLTEHEREALQLIASGCSNAEIEGAMTVSEATAKTHVAHVLEKLGLRDRVHAVIYAYDHGLVN